MTNEETAEVLGYLSAAYRVELSEATVLVWAQALGDLDHGDCLNAAVRVAKSSPFMPSVAELRAAAAVDKDRRERNYTVALPAPPKSDEEKAQIRRFQQLCKETIESQRRALLGDAEYETRRAAFLAQQEARKFGAGRAERAGLKERAAKRNEEARKRAATANGRATG